MANYNLRKSRTKYNGTTKGSDQPGAEGGVKSYYPTLTFSPSNNHVDWLEQFYLISEIKFCGSVNRFVRTHNEPIFARDAYLHGEHPENPDLLDNAEGDVLEAIEEDERNQAEELIDYDNQAVVMRIRDAKAIWQKLRSTFFEDQRLMCAHIQYALSDSSRTQIRAYHNAPWTAAVAAKDCYRMLRLIQTSHSISGSARPTLIDRDQALDTIKSSLQGKHESLEAFRERFTEDLQKCRDIGIDEVVLPVEETVYYFVKGVTHHLARLCRTDLINKFANHRDLFPATVDEAFSTLAQSIRTQQDSNAYQYPSKVKLQATSHIANVAAHKSKTNAGAIGGKQNKQCGYCGKVGHLAETCMALKEFVKTNGKVKIGGGKGKGPNATLIPAKRVRFNSGTRSPSDNKPANNRKNARKNVRKRDDDSDDEDDVDNPDDDDEDEDAFMYGTTPPKKKKQRKATKYGRSNLALVQSEIAYAYPVVTSLLSEKQRAQQIILDSGANVHLVNNKALLTNPKSSDAIRVKGVSAKTQVAKICGDVGPFGKGYYLPECSYNILSMAALSKKFRVRYDNVDDDCFEVYTESRPRKLVARFTRTEDDLYALDATECEAVEDLLLRLLGPSASVSHISGEVIDPELPIMPIERQYGEGVGKNLTKIQKERALEAMDLHCQLGHPNDAYLCKLLDAKGLRGTSVTGKDVRTGRSIVGPCPACLKGKATIPKQKGTSPEPSDPPPYAGHTYNADIVFVGNAPNLRVSESVTKYGTMIPLTKKDKTSISDALLVHFGRMLGIGGMPARVLRCDNEVVFASVSDALAKSGIIIQQSPSGNHCGAIEAQVRADRQALRALFAALPYTVPAVLHQHAAVDVARMRNLSPNSATKDRSPLEIITKRKPKVEDLSLPWGTVVYATNPTPNDKTSARSDLGIVISHNFETRIGSVDVLIIDTRSPAKPRLQIVNRPSRLVKRAAEAELPAVRAFMKALDKEHPSTKVSGDIIDYNPHAEEPLDSTVDDGRSDDTLDAPAPTATALPPPVPAPTPAENDNPFLQMSEATPEQAAVATPSPTTPSTPPGLDIVPSTEPNAHKYSLRDKANIRTPERFVNNVKITTALNLTVRQALKMHGNAASDAIKAELEALLRLKAWTPLKSPKQRKQSKHTKIIPCSMFLKEKYTADGTFEKIKARLVAGGHRVDHSLYSKEETAAWTVKSETLMLVLALAAHEHEDAETFDFPSAYLNEKLVSPQVMRIAPDLAEQLVNVEQKYKKYVQKDGTILVNVVGALYGLPEAGKLWHSRLTKSLTNIGYKQSHDDPCLFYRTEGKERSTLVIHVDDMLHTWTQGAKKLRQELHDALITEYKTVKNSTMNEDGQLSYLGMNIVRNKVTCNDGKKRNGFSITMPSFLESALFESRITGTAKTPSTSELFSINQKLQPVGSPTVFLSKVMKLMYLAKKVRPDILLPCSFLASRAKTPTIEDWNKLRRVYRYLNGTRGLPTVIAPDSSRINAYADASYNVHVDGKGQSGRIIGVGSLGGPALLKSVKQNIVTRSSTESELVSLSDCTADVILMTRLSQFLGFGSPKKPPVIYQDNKSAIQMAEAGRGGKSGNSKHISVRYFFIKQFLDNKELQLEHLPTKEMTADIFTKPLVGELFYSLRGKLLNLPPRKP